MRSVAERSAGVRSAKPRGARALILSALDMVLTAAVGLGKTWCGPPPCGGEGQGFFRFRVIPGEPKAREGDPLMGSALWIPFPFAALRPGMTPLTSSPALCR